MINSSISATDALMEKKPFGSRITTLIVSNEEINYIMKIVKSFEKSGSLIKGVNKRIQNEAK